MWQIKDNGNDEDDVRRLAGPGCHIELLEIAALPFCYFQDTHPPDQYLDWLGVQMETEGGTGEKELDILPFEIIIHLY